MPSSWDAAAATVLAEHAELWQRLAALSTSDWMEIIDPDLDSNPRTVRHRTINGAGFVARILRGKR